MGPREVVGEVDSQEPEARNTFHLHTVNVDGGVRAAPGLPEVYNELLGLLGC